MIVLNNILNEELTKKQVYKLILGEEPLTSGNKLSQEKRLRSKCNFYTVGKGRGTKYIVTEIYKSDIPIYDGRVNNKGGNRVKTAHLLESAIIYALLGQQLEKGEELKYTELLLPQNNALVVMQMVNKEYIKRYHKNYDGLEEVIDEHLIEKYFMMNHAKIQRRLESALNILSRKSLIHFSKTIQIKTSDEEYVFRKATMEEITTILEVEYETMHELLKDKYELDKMHKGLLFMKGLYKRFYDECINKLHEKGLEYIESYCNAYEISTTSNLLLSDIKIYNLEDSVKKIKEDLKRMCNYNIIKDLEKTRKKIEDNNRCVFGNAECKTEHIDEHIKSVKLFTEMIF